MNQLARIQLSPTQFINNLSQQVDSRLNQLDPELLLSFYRTMVLIRQFDKKAVALQRTGQMGTYPSCLGQEAFSTGIGYA